MSYLCVIDKDSKITAEIKSASEKLLPEAKLTFISFQNLPELDQFIETETNKDPTKPTEVKISLLVLSADGLADLSQESLQKIRDKYKSRIVLTPFEDPLKPLKKIETWPIENIIYKPFDPNILQEHLRFSAIDDRKLTPLAVHSSKESCKIEKIRRHPFAALSDFGFKLKSKTKFEVGKVYKFYHFIFQNQKKSSLWAKLVYKNEEDHEFIFCHPSLPVLNNLRKKATDPKSKLKDIIFHGSDKNRTLERVQVGIEMTGAEELKSFIARRFPAIEVIDITPDGKAAATGSGPAQPHVVVSEAKYDAKSFTARFGADALYFHVTNDPLPDREEALTVLSFESARLPKPLDRNYFLRLMMAYFPALKDADPVAVSWFSVTEDSLHSEIVVAKEFSEAAFMYERDSLLPRGNYQEFALPQEDETELKILKAKIQWADEKPQQNKLFLHQVIFYGIRDNLLKKIRLWQLQAHISKKSAES